MDIVFTMSLDTVVAKLLEPIPSSLDGVSWCDSPTTFKLYASARIHLGADMMQYY